MSRRLARRRADRDDSQREGDLAPHDIVLTAPSGVEAFAELVGREIAFALRVVTIGPTTSEAARHAGFTVSAESLEQSVDGLITAIQSLRNR